MKYKSNQFSSFSGIARAFGKYFESIFVLHSNPVIPDSCSRDVPLFSLPYVSPDDVKAVILNLNPHSARGYDNVPAVFLIRCADQLCFPLAEIFNLSVSLGEYPCLLKFNNIVPIYKFKGDKSCVESYRPISIQPVVSKIFERIVNNSLRKHLKAFLCDEQHGFVPKKSTLTNLSCYKDFITTSLDQGYQVHAIYTDFNKAFDSVCHEYLLHKMSTQFGIFGNDLKWFQSYLSNRFQRVLVHGEESEWAPVASGVPQGSILGPSLFLMYVNDIPESLQFCETLLFADDLKLFKRITCVQDCHVLQSALISLYHWCCKWKMSLNFHKCFYLNFSLKRSRNIDFDYDIHGTLLQSVSSIKDLGVYFSQNMCFSMHIHYVVKKAFRMLGFVRRTLKPFKDVTLLKIMYNAHVRSHLDYCSSIWSPQVKYLKDKIEKVQKVFIKELCFIEKVKFDSRLYFELCSQFGLATLENRRTVSDLLYFHKILHGRVNCAYLVSNIWFHLPLRRTRHTNVLTCDIQRGLSIRKADFIPRSISIVNSIPEIDFFDCDHSKMKRIIKKLYC